MSDSTAKVIADFEKLLSPERVRTNLVQAALLVMAFELVRSSIEQHILGFYAVDFDGLRPKESSKYRERVAGLARNRFEACLLWLEAEDAITSDERVEFQAIRKRRNDIVHELAKYLIDTEYEVGGDKLHLAATDLDVSLRALTTSKPFCDSTPRLIAGGSAT